MKAPLSIKIIQGFMLLQIFVLVSLYVIVELADPMNLSHWASKIVFRMVDMPQDMLEQSYVLGRLKGMLTFPLFFTSLLALFIKLRMLKTSTGCIILIMLLDVSKGTFLVAIVYLVILLVLLNNKQAKVYFQQKRKTKTAEAA
ncbi:hypothetical protein AV540_11830 [Brevibacillus parabrevis]|uniref:hypothetical protein n=1 Tax=Brevibacillus parabrevis TaxID=54914 RepID=UPI0007AC269B|nr:hypothetical protein [Brevibacillus parabrevis]KZE51964.1 hypothetical protein AV540_11830 [Brevibacillus parabrevis]